MATKEINCDTKTTTDISDDVMTTSGASHSTPDDIAKFIIDVDDRDQDHVSPTNINCTNNETSDTTHGQPDGATAENVGTSTLGTETVSTVMPGATGDELFPDHLVTHSVLEALLAQLETQPRTGDRSEDNMNIPVHPANTPTTCGDNTDIPVHPANTPSRKDTNPVSNTPPTPIATGELTTGSGDNAPPTSARSDSLRSSLPPQETKTDEMDGKFGSLKLCGLLETKSTAKNRNKDCMYSYKMNHKYSGMFIIINNKTFVNSLRLEERIGTDRDAARLYDIFQRLGFKVKCYNNLTCAQMRLVLKHEAEQSHRDADCFACAILSHGFDGGHVYGIDHYITLDKLISPFKGPGPTSLAGKPKLFFIQACRGVETDPGLTMWQTDGAGEDSSDACTPPALCTIPIEADFLYAYSTVPGYLSWRNSEKGSWFVQALYDVLNEYGFCKDIMWILTRVNHQVAYTFTSNCSDRSMHEKKQIPCIVSMLTKELIFTKKPAIKKESTV